MTTLHKQQGFTLVEVITVMVLLVALATITVKSTSQLAFDGRYQVTQDRYDKIKKAIIGDPNQIINGQPNIEGFVKDVGRFPSCIRELIDGYDCETQGSCSNVTDNRRTVCYQNGGTWTPSTVINFPYCLDNTYTTKINCEANNKTWIVGICSNSAHLTKDTCVSGEVWRGFSWNSAYLETTVDATNNNALTDGWGNLGSTNDGNYGWLYHCQDSSANTVDCGNNALAVNLFLQSIGKDGVTTATTDIYDANYPNNNQPTIAEKNWHISLPTIFNVTITPKANKKSPHLIRPTTETSCTDLGGIWTAANSPQCSIPSLDYNQTECNAANATWDSNNFCSSIKLPQSICIIYGGTWSGGNCLNLPYKTVNTCLVLPNGVISTNYQPIVENGIPQTVSFNISVVNNVEIGVRTFKFKIYDGVPTPNCSAASPVETLEKVFNVYPNSELNFTW